MQRHLFQYLLNHFGGHRQMAFLSGPRQVGKTTLAKGLAAHRAGGHYFNWDNQSHRETLLSGPDAIAAAAGLDRLVEQPQILAFDELHKYRHWRDLLKGLFDQYEDRARMLVTGSASLTAFRRGGKA